MFTMLFSQISGYSHVRQYTRKGIKKSRLPDAIFGDILDFRREKMLESGWVRGMNFGVII